MTNEVMEMAQKIRREWGANDAMRDANLSSPKDVKRYDNILYGDDPVWQSLDVYCPRYKSANGNRLLPVIVNVHGGGWIYGTKEVYQYYCMSLCQRGFAVVNFNYRLAPEHPFPAALEDTERVFKWTAQNMAQYCIKKNNPSAMPSKTDGEHLMSCAPVIFAVGDSAGAHILALYAATHKDSNLCAIALNCGAYHGPMGDLKEAVCNNSNAQNKMNALSKIGKDFPPTFCMTATGDSLKSESIDLFRRLVKAGVPCECRLYGTADNLLPHVFHVDINRKEAKECNDDTAAWFNKWQKAANCSH